jgi:hypothetical protein
MNGKGLLLKEKEPQMNAKKQELKDKDYRGKEKVNRPSVPLKFYRS